MYIYIYMYTHTHIHIYIYVCIHISLSIYIYIYICAAIFPPAWAPTSESLPCRAGRPDDNDNNNRSPRRR